MNSAITQSAAAALQSRPASPVSDRFGRPLRDLRLSVLDRCNFRCGYCMPADELDRQAPFLPREQLLTDAEIHALVMAFAELGVDKVRLTGGEPLLRPGLSHLVERLASIDGVRDLALTTNGVLLPRHAHDLAAAGLGRVTVSLDSMDEDVFARMSGGHGSVREVLDGIAAAEAAGFGQLKINTVVQRGVNDAGVLDLVDHFRGTGHTLRLIEFMDVGNLNHWSREQVVPSAELLRRIHRRWPLRPVARQPSSETARRYTFEDGQGEVGFISSITEPFCGDCTRARVTADGTFYSCLFSNRGMALRPLLRQAGETFRLGAYLKRLWEERDDRYSEVRNGGNLAPHVEMYRMGG